MTNQLDTIAQLAPENIVTNQLNRFGKHCVIEKGNSNFAVISAWDAVYYLVTFQAVVRTDNVARDLRHQLLHIACPVGDRLS